MDSDRMRNSLMPVLISGLFLLTYLWLGTVGTMTHLYYHWPVLGAFGICLVLGLFPNQPSRSSRSNAAIISVVVLAAYVLVRAGSSPIPYSARKDVCLLLGCAAVYLLFVFVLHQASHRRMAVIVFGTLGVANTILALYQRLVDPSFQPFHPSSSTTAIPGSGLYYNYDHMAGFAELAALLCLSMAIFGSGGLRFRILYAGLGLTSVVGVLTSTSRGGFLSLGAGLLVLAALTWFASKRLGWGSRLRRNFAMAVVVGFIAFLATGVTLIGKRFESEPNSGTETGHFQIGFSNRLENWNLAFRQWQLRPIVGTGSGTYDEYSIKLWRGDWHRPDRIRHPINAHNDYIQMMAEYGLLGLGLVLMVLAMHAGRGLSVLRGWIRNVGGPGTGESPNHRMALVAGSLSCLAAYSVHSVVDFNMRILASACVLAFCLAVLASAGPRRRNQDGRDPARTGARLMGAIIGIFLLVGMVRNLKPEFHFEQLNRALSEERIDDALSHGARAVKAEKRNDILYRLLGYARMRSSEHYEIPSLRSGFLANAVEALKIATNLNPGDSYANVLLGRCLDQMEDREGAEAAFKRGLDWDPYGGDTNGWYGELLLKQGMEELDRGDEGAALQTLEEAKRYLLIGTQSSGSLDIWQQDVYADCRDALHEAYSAKAQRLDDEAKFLVERGEKSAARAKYLEAFAAYKASLELKPTGSAEARPEAVRYTEISRLLATDADH